MKSCLWNLIRASTRYRFHLDDGEDDDDNDDHEDDGGAHFDVDGNDVDGK